MPCRGNAKTHCCWLKGNVCKYLEEDTVADRRWACGLRRELGDWDKVLASVEYTTHIAPHFGPKGINCKDWPDKTDSGPARCGDCGFGCS
jgi:hypothetical protein